MGSRAIVLICMAACGSSSSSGKTPDAAVSQPDARVTTFDARPVGTDAARADAPVVATPDAALPDAVPAAPDAHPVITGKRVFVTNQAYFPDLVSAAGGTDGPSSADIICNNTAAAAGLSGTWTAWISTTKVDAIDRITGTGPWYGLDGTKLFLNHANLATTPASPGIRYDEMGNELDTNVTTYFVWTGTALGGRNGTSATCSGWTDSLDADSGTAGFAGDWDFTWTNGSLDTCDAVAHLYCFEE